MASLLRRFRAQVDEEGRVTLRSVRELRIFWRRVSVQKLSRIRYALVFDATHVIHRFDSSSLCHAVEEYGLQGILRRVELLAGDSQYYATQPLHRWVHNGVLRLELTPVAIANQSAVFKPSNPAAWWDDAARVAAFHSEGGDISTWVSSRRPLPATVAAAKYGSVAGLQQLLQLNADPNTIGIIVDPGAEPRWTTTALTEAAFNGCWDAVLCLLEAKADVNLGCSDGFTPLMQAAWANMPEKHAHRGDLKNYTDIAALLTLMGADVDVCDPHRDGAGDLLQIASRTTSEHQLGESLHKHVAFFCNLSQGVPLQFRFSHLPNYPAVFREASVLIVRTVLHPTSANPFRLLTIELKKIILEQVLAAKACTDLWYMVGERVWEVLDSYGDT